MKMSLERKHLYTLRNECVKVKYTQWRRHVTGQTLLKHAQWPDTDQGNKWKQRPLYLHDSITRCYRFHLTETEFIESSKWEIITTIIIPNQDNACYMLIKTRSAQLSFQASHLHGAHAGNQKY